MQYRNLKSDKFSLANSDYLNTDVSFDLTISVLGGVTGVQVTDEHCEGVISFGKLLDHSNFSILIGI